MAKVLKVVVFVLAITGARAQSPVPVSSLPTADSLGQNDFFPIIQGGHYHKAFIYQLPRLAQPPGQILYGTGGGIGSDTSFTWNPITGLRAYYHYRGGAIGLGNLTDVLGVDSAALLYGSNSAFINSKNTFIQGHNAINISSDSLLSISANRGLTISGDDRINISANKVVAISGANIEFNNPTLSNNIVTAPGYIGDNLIFYSGSISNNQVSGSSAISDSYVHGDGCSINGNVLIADSTSYGSTLGIQGIDLMGGSRIDSNIISALGWISSIRCYRGSSVSHNKFDRNSQLMQINNLTLSTGDSVSYNLLTGLAAEIQTIPQAGTSSINYDTLTRSYSFIKNITQLNGHIQNCRIDSSRSGYNMIDLKDADIFNATDISITDVVLQGVTLNLSGFHHNISNETIINGSGAFTASYSFFNNPLSTGQPILLNLIPPGFSVTKLIITSSGSITNGSTLTIDLSGGDTSLINILTDSLNRSNYYWTGVSKAATSNQCLSVSPNSTINSGSLNVYLEIVNLAAPTSRVIFIK